MAESRVRGIDALRGFAALAVVFAHVVYLDGYTHLIGAADMAATGTLAVEMFFAISAFSLCLAYDGALDTASSLSRYFVKRFLRIAPLFYVMLGVWLAYRAAIVGAALPNANLVSANMSFAFGLFPGWHESIVPAGWSLGVEMLFYLLFPVLALTIRGVRSALLLVVGSWCLAWLWSFVLLPDFGVAGTFRRMSLVWQLPNFAGGIAAYHVYRAWRGMAPSARKRIAMRLWAATLGWWLALAFVSDYIVVDQFLAWRAGISVVFPLALVAIAIHRPSFLERDGPVFLGTISYGIYLIHPFVIVATKTMRTVDLVPSGRDWLDLIVAFSIVATVTIAVAYLSWRFLEAPLMNLARRWRQSPLAVPAAAQPTLSRSHAPDRRRNGVV